MTDQTQTTELCDGDGEPCYVNRDPDEAHWRCGTVQCGKPTNVFQNGNCSTDKTTVIEDAIEAGIEAASRWVSEGNESFLVGNRGWSSKDFHIAERSAREAIAALRQAEAGK